MTSKEGARQKIRRDMFCMSRRSWFHLGHDGSIYIVNQKSGEKASWTARLTRAEFEQFKDFYERGTAALEMPRKSR